VTTPDTIELPSRTLRPGVADLLKSLAAGDMLKVTQTVRVGAKKWEAVATGSFRGVNYLATGVTTDRVPEDDIVVPTVHFTKPNGELASVALDEYTRVERA
jgi:hypothetical protein